MTRRSFDHIDLQATTRMLEMALFESVMFCHVSEDTEEIARDEFDKGKHYGAWWEMDPLRDLKLD